MNVREYFPHEEQAKAALRMRLCALGVLACVPVLRIGYEVPQHLAPLADVYERAYAAARGDGPPVRALVSAPSQVGKTTLGQVAAAWWLNKTPTDHLAFLSYGQDIANIKSAEVRDDARAIGLELRNDTTAKDLWRTSAGGSFLARGLGGGVTGMSGLRLIDIDDPYMNRSEAESAAHRRRVESAVRAVAFSRIHPFTSVIIKHARWTPDDVIGVFEKELGDVFESHTIPAVGDDGEPVVTMGGRDAAFWSSQRRLMGEHDWWSLMMGRPRPREGTLFRGLSTYTVGPSSGRTCIGVDFAYSSRSSADHSVAVVLTRVDHRVYVRHVSRMQCDAPTFGAELRALRSRFGGSLRAYIGGTERGTVDFLSRDGLAITALPATADKYSRAQGAAAAWNASNVLVPESAAWLDAFVSELLDFGPRSTRDDQVDAFVAAFDGLGIEIGEASNVVPISPSLFGTPRTHGRRGPW